MARPTTFLGMMNLLNLPVSKEYLNDEEDYKYLQKPLSIAQQVHMLIICQHVTPAAHRALRQMAEGKLRWTAQGQIIIKD